MKHTGKLKEENQQHMTATFFMKKILHAIKTEFMNDEPHLKQKNSKAWLENSYMSCMYNKQQSAVCPAD